jgi:hypothetical protein
MGRGDESNNETSDESATDTQQPEEITVTGSRIVPMPELENLDIEGLGIQDFVEPQAGISCGGCDLYNRAVEIPKPIAAGGFAVSILFLLGIYMMFRSRSWAGHIIKFIVFFLGTISMLINLLPFAVSIGFLPEAVMEIRIAP